MRLGIYGGSFDPIHYGHLVLAEACREERQLDEVRFVPAAVPPHKQDSQLTSSTQRLEMLHLAIDGHPCFNVSTIELDRGGVSYTVETLAAIDQEVPDATLFLLMGADSLADLPTWYEPREICRLATPLVARRPGQSLTDLKQLQALLGDAKTNDIRRHMLETPLIGLSSTDIRQRVAAGKSIRFRTPRAVEQYIAENGLYQLKGAG